MTPEQSRWLRLIEEEVGRDDEDDGDNDEEESETDDDTSGDGSEDLGESGGEDEESDERLEGLVLEFFISLLDQNIGDNQYESALVSGLAVLGADEGRGWTDPLIYTPTLAAVVTVSRMMVLYKANRHRECTLARLRSEGLGEEEAESEAPTHFELVCSIVHKFMTLTRYGGQPSPMDWILRLKTYGMKIRFNTHADGIVDWQGDRLLYGGIRFTMVELRAMIYGMIQTTKVELLKDLLVLDADDEGTIKDHTTPLPVIEWGDLVDNPAETKTGWSFSKDPRNTFGGVDGESWMTGRVSRERKLREEFIDVEAMAVAMREGRGVVWRAQRAVEYEKAMRRFRERILVCMHMTGGQPARGTELVSVQAFNSANGESRGVFVEDGLMVYVTRYHKGVGMTGKSKVIHRYLPREVGELLMYYLWLVDPFWRRLVWALGGGRDEDETEKAFIWKPKRGAIWEPRLLQKRRERHKRRRTATDIQGREGEEGQEKESGPRFTPERWDTDRVRRALQKASVEWMGVKIHIMCWRHSSVAMYRRYIDNRTAVKAVLAADEDGQDGEGTTRRSTYKRATVRRSEVAFTGVTSTSPHSTPSHRGRRSGR